MGVSPFRQSKGNAHGAASLDLPTAATTLAYAGWPVFPCAPMGKKPLVEHGFHAATTDARQVYVWWRKWPKANIGYPTGRLVVVEVDGGAGLASMTALRKAHDWPVTLTVMSGRAEGGSHFYFQAPETAEPIKNCVGMSHDGKRGLGNGIDVRGVGGYVVVPPSVHESGRRYRWAARAEVAPLPAWMAECLKPPEQMKMEPPKGNGERYGQAALEGEVRAIAEAASGTLNHTLNRSAFKLGIHVVTGALTEEDVCEALLVAAVNAGHPERGAVKTIRSGLSGGMRGTA